MYSTDKCYFCQDNLTFFQCNNSNCKKCYGYIPNLNEINFYLLDDFYYFIIINVKIKTSSIYLSRHLPKENHMLYTTNKILMPEELKSVVLKIEKLNLFK